MRLPLSNFRIPNDEGTFGAVRKHDIHTGIDLYCKPGTRVFAIEDGVIVSIEDFTGQNAGSPWWNDTKAVLVEGKHGVICYGEIEPTLGLYVGYNLKEGMIVGRVLKVLKKNKGKPMSMLHLELYKHGTTKTVWWQHGQPKPDELLDPRFELFMSENWQ